MHLIHRLLHRWGIGRLTLLITLACTTISALATWLAMQANGIPNQAFGLTMSTVLPLTLTSTTCWALLSLIQRLDRAERRLQELVHRDDLTQLYNRRFFIQQAQQLLAKDADPRFPITVMLFDLDSFKALNDNHGHLFGDTVLVRIAETADSTLPEEAILARYGGEEFVVLLPTSLQQAYPVAEELRQAIARLPFDYDGSSLQVTTSIGLACNINYGNDLDTLLSMADTALYQAKHAGRNRVHASLPAGHTVSVRAGMKRY